MTRSTSDRHRTTVRSAATVAVTVLLALTLAACGSSGSDASGATTDTGSATSAPSDGPVTVTHHYGTTTLDAPPERIVSLDAQWTDVLVALDAPLVGAALDPTIEGGRYPWQDGIHATVEDIPVTDSIPYEAVAALQPDLIVVTWGATSQADYDRLSQVAPTIPMLGDGDVDSWQDIATAAGQVTGKPDQAQALIDESDARGKALAAELPGLQGKTFALANYVPGDAIYVVADPDDGSAKLFAQLGMKIEPDLLALADANEGRAKLSLERIGELDADLLIILTNGADPNAIPGYSSLPAVTSGAIAVLDLAEVVGLNTPTPLSVPYSLEHIHSALEAAAS